MTDPERAAEVGLKSGSDGSVMAPESGGESVWQTLEDFRTGDRADLLRGFGG